MFFINVKKEERGEAKELLKARWKPGHANPCDPNASGCWYVFDDKVNLVPEKWLIEQEKGFSEFLKEVGGEVKVPGGLFRFKADVNEEYHDDDKSYVIYTVLANHELTKRLKVKVPVELLDGKDPAYFLDKEVDITGKVYVYAPYLAVQVEAKRFKEVGPCLRLRELQDWKNICWQLKEKQAPKRATWKDWTEYVPKIGLIGKPTSKGYMDFMDRILSMNRIPAENIIHKDVVLRLEDITKAVKELNEAKECDYICIVRGGGNTEELAIYSNPELLEAMEASNIPIIVGVGHKGDDVLCNELAFYAANTPADAANWINIQEGKRRNQRRKAASEKYVKNKIESAKNATEEWKAKCQDAEARIEELKEEISDLNLQINILNDKIVELMEEKKPEEEKRSFLSRIFHW